MTLEQLIAMGLTKEQAEKVMEGLDGNFVPKSRFNEVNAELKQTKETLKERDGQLDSLKKSGGDIETLRTQITELQKENKNRDEAHRNEIKQIKFDNALTSALTGAKARNPETVKPLLKAFLEKAELDGDSIKGLDAELKKLTDSEDTKFLFNTDAPSKPTFKGVKPGETGTDKPDGSGKTFNSYEELAAHMAEGTI